MKADVLPLSKYNELYGPLSSRGMTEEHRAFWERIKKLPITDVLIVEPGKGEDAETLKKQLYARYRKLAQASNFDVKYFLNKGEGHVAIAKFARTNGNGGR